MKSLGKAHSLFFFLVATSSVVAMIMMWRDYMPVSKKTYIIGVFSHWGTLTPPLQHSAAGDVILAYQFEPLVKTGNRGIMEPLAAKSWEFTKNQHAIRFKIDTSRRFSDGSYLCAADFKRSWEDGLRMESMASNSSLADGLGNLKGYNRFKEKGEIEGVRVIGDDELELCFERPIRLALGPLSGGRFSAYKIIDNHPIGTGPYVITEKDQVLTLVPNTYYIGQAPGLKNVKIVVALPPTVLEKLKSEEIDAYLFAETANLPGCDEGRLAPIRCAYGQEGLHILINLNGMAGRFFADSKHRRALQALVLKNIELAEKAFRARGFIRDSQSFLKLQSGRIPDSEAQSIIQEGEQYIPRLLKATKQTPLHIAAGTLGWQWFIDFLRKEGLTIADSSRADFTAKEFWETYYKTLTPDIMPMGASVGDSDPDGLYHLLGRHGAIFSPILERGTVCDGMESGRQLLDIAQLPAHYEKVSREILKEVPYIHLGYLYTRVAYNTSKLQINEKQIGRGENPSIMLLKPR